MVVPAVEIGADALLPSHAAGGWDGTLVSGVAVGMWPQWPRDRDGSWDWQNVFDGT